MEETIPPSNLVLGRHALIDLSGCNPAIIRDDARIRSILIQAAHLAKVTVVNTVDRHFMPEGYTAILVLEESHLSLHTWPEYNYISIDLYSCNLQTDFQGVKAFLADQFQATTTTFTLVERGCLPPETQIFISDNLLRRNYDDCSHPAIQFNGVNGDDTR